jgi:hypothetical protein
MRPCHLHLVATTVATVVIIPEVDLVAVVLMVCYGLAGMICLRLY